MKRTQIACLIAAGLALSPLAFAGKNAPAPLATITPEGCSFAQIASFGTSLLASWSWADGTAQTKFGGDAAFDVEASLDGGATWIPLEIEFELVKYKPGTPADEYAGVMVYRCSNAATEPSGRCNGSVLGVRAAILEAAADELGVTPADIGPNLRASLAGVDVKAMNPGKGGGRQNYPLVDVCAVTPP